MSKRDNDNEKRLKDFLENRKPADDFEKEALEGFDMLANEQEAFDLKQEMDRKLYAESFAEKSSSSRSYWFAAAGLILCIGFAVYFVRNTVQPEKNMAIHQAETKSSEAEASEAAPAAEPLTKTSAPEQLPAPETKRVREAPKASPADEVPGEKEIRAAEAADDRMDAGVEAEAAKPMAAPVAPVEEKALAKDEADMDKKAKVSNGAAHPKADEERRESMAAPGKAKNERAKKRAEEPAAAYSAQDQAATAQAPVVASYYEGGAEALYKELNVKLKRKGVNHRFTANLSIGPKNNVQKVDYLSSEEFNKNELEDLTKILKALGKFHNDSGADAVYLLDYRP